MVDQKSIRNNLQNPPVVLPDKIRALKEIVQYGRRNSVAINLENLSETAEDLEPAISELMKILQQLPLEVTILFK
ncbi:MAG: hypothetical protein M1511_04460 [Deltaproteobacteria bacterium]|nr:hypothetical protein [Deltaproteobacteria bacterium]